MGTDPTGLFTAQALAAWIQNWHFGKLVWKDGTSFELHMERWNPDP
jgi:hypothetical protein